MNEKPSESSLPNGLKQLNWPTVVLILVTGGGNFLAGQQGRYQLSYEQQEAITKVREIHQELDDFESGIKASLNNQTQILKNQTLILEQLKERPNGH